MKKHELYINQKTGGMAQATRQSAKKLPADYKKVEFGADENGRPTARLRIEGATIDITENEPQEVPKNVNASAN